MISILAIASIASITVLGNTQTAFAGGVIGCNIDPDMVDAGVLGVGDRFVVLKTVTCSEDIIAVDIDNSDCVAKGIDVRLGDFGINGGVWDGEEVIDNIPGASGKTTCTVEFQVEFIQDSVNLFQTIMLADSIVPVCGDMYVVTGRNDNNNVEGGALALVDYPGTGDLTRIGISIAEQVDRDSLTGMAFDPSGRLFVIARGAGDTSLLLEIDPSNGAIIDNIGTVREGSGDPVHVRDLAMRNNVLWGVGENNDNVIFSISTTSAVIGPKGDTGFVELNGLAVIGNTFYATERFADELYTVDSDGVTTFVVNLDTNMDGLGSDDLGRLFGTETGPDSVHLIDISDGSDMTVGAVGDNPSDVDFFPCEEKVVGGKLLQIESTSLILASAQSFSWMIPLVLSVLGIGLFVVSRKSE